MTTRPQGDPVSSVDRRESAMWRVAVRLSEDGTPRFAFGGDYNPEQWPESAWVEDAELMKRIGVNLVSVAVFSWSLLEPREGDYQFGWLDRVLDLLHNNQIRVNLANATASPPPWFSRKYPNSLPVTADGTRHSYGSRQAFCASSQDYRRAAASLTQAIVDRYDKHPAVVMWHVHNEYGCHNQPCYCETSAIAFRVWLRRRYDTVERLNEAWGTAFWSQRYYDWNEVVPPRVSGTWVNPTQQLDFARFSSDELLDCFKAEARILRAGSAQPVTTNFMGFTMGLHRPVDYWRWAGQMDIVSNDHYLIAEDRENYQELAMTADLSRGWANGSPWLLMEHSTSAVNWQPRNIAKVPGELLRNSVQHIARGADGALFFQWRASKAGAEKFHSAILPHAGTETKVWREAQELGSVMRSISEVVGSRVVDVGVAIVHDTDARWASEIDSHPSADVSAITETRRWHDSLYRSNIVADFRRSTDDLSGYRLVIVPVQYLITDEGADNLLRYVASGGHLVVTYFSGITDANDHIRLGGYPGAFRDLLGVRIEEFFPLRYSETVRLSEYGHGSVWSELGNVTTASVLAEYAEGPTVRSPAVTANRFAGGTAYYVGTSLNRAGLDALINQITDAAGVSPVLTGLPPGVEVVNRADSTTIWTFVINHTDREASVALPGTDLINNREIADDVRVAAGGVAVIRRSRCGP